MRKKIILVKELELHMDLKLLPDEYSRRFPTFFLVSTTLDAIPCPFSPKEAADILPTYFETGTLSCIHPLQALARTLSYLYVPMLKASGTCAKNLTIVYT